MQVTQTVRVFLSTREIREALKIAYPHHIAIQSMADNGQNTEMSWSMGLAIDVKRDVTAAQERVRLLTAGSENAAESL